MQLHDQLLGDPSTCPTTLCRICQPPELSWNSRAASFTQCATVSSPSRLLRSLVWHNPYLCGSATEKGKPSNPFEIRGNSSGAMLAMYAVSILMGTCEIETLRPRMRSWCLDYLVHIGSKFSIKQAHAYHRLHAMRLQQNSGSPQAARLNTTKPAVRRI